MVPGMKTAKIRVGVAGLGRIGWTFHCREISSHAQFVLEAVADADADRCREAEKSYGCRAYRSFEEMLGTAALDAVVIATPTHLHKEMSLAAFRRGLHVFLEKPMAACLKDARAIVAASSRAGRILTVYQPHRAAAYFQHVRKIIASGRIGAVYHVRRGSFNYVRRNDWQSLRRYGGGMLNNYGAHFLDQLLALTGSDVKDLFCRLRRVATLGDADDVVKVVYGTGRGITAELDVNMGSPIAPYELEVYGTRGTVVLHKDTLTVRSFSPRQLPPKRLDASLASAARAYPVDDVRFRETTVPVDQRLQVDVYADLARAIRTGSVPFIPPRETLTLMEVMERCRREAGEIITSRESGGTA
jgi:scyllo-inositol 2-dehydrogenase (NADP+)